MYKLSDGLETFYRLHMDALDLNVYKALTQNMILTKLRDFPQQSFPLHAVLLTVSFLMAALLEACDHSVVVETPSYVLELMLRTPYSCRTSSWKKEHV